MSIQPSFDKHLTAWKLAVAGKSHAPLPVDVVAESLEQFTMWQNRLAKVKVEAEKAGYVCQYNKGGKPGRFAAWVVSGGFTLKVVYTDKAKRPQAVTQTSREAYHSLDFTTQRGQIAAIIFDSTMKGKSITRKEIEVFHGLGCNVVAGRVKELLEMSEAAQFVFGQYKYRLKVTGTRLSKCEGASNVPNEELVWMWEPVAGEVNCSRQKQNASQQNLFQ